MYFIFHYFKRSTLSTHQLDANMSTSTASCYVDKLRQLFISCDTSGIDLLNKDELAELCDKLQLDEEQTFYIIDHLIVDQFTKVSLKMFILSFLTYFLLLLLYCNI